MDQRDGRYSEEESDRRKRARLSKKQRRRRVRIAIRLALLACMAAFVVGGVIAGIALIENSRADRAYDGLRLQLQEAAYIQSFSAEALSVPVETPVPTAGEPAARTSTMDFSPLKEINQEIVAWLVCEGTAIDYPVLHAEDNEFYLSHLYTKERNRMGSLFVDYRNTGLFTERNTVIYGHNMNSGDMFHALSAYEAQDYYDAFPTMTLYTPEGDFTIELFAGTIEDGDYEFVEFAFRDNNAFLAYIDDLRTRSIFQSDVAVTQTDRIITLCTCSFERNNARYALMGKLVSK